jgi:hypothetical protein
VTTFGYPFPLPSVHPTSPVVAIASTPRLGYWLLEADGTVLGFGDARTYGLAKPLPASDPAVAIASSRDGDGYVVLTAEGQLIGYGDARSVTATTPVAKGSTAVGLALMASGPLVLDSNGVVTGGTGGPSTALPLSAGAATAITATPDGDGYWVLTATGQVIAHGDAKAEGSGLQGATGTAVAIAAV